tara:strand:+ start:13111 stop:13428 length:318 start_codon:yes stop_codon:yes gene_type:complete
MDTGNITRIITIRLTTHDTAKELKEKLEIKNEENTEDDIAYKLDEYFNRIQEKEIEGYINDCGGIHEVLIYYCNEGYDIDLNMTKKEIMCEMLKTILPSIIYYLE